MPADQSVWILAFSDYDSYTIVGVYTTEALATAERERVEQLQVEHGDRPRRRFARDGSYTVEEFVLNRTGCDIIARVRADGALVETCVRVGYHVVTSNYEPRFEGIAATLDEAVAAARQQAKDRADVR